MAQLRHDYDLYRAREADVIVVGPEDTASFARFWADNDLPFVGLPNPDQSVLKLYGQQIKLFKLGRMPAQVLIDKQGIARFVHYGNSMADIPDNAEVLTLLDELNEEWASQGMDRARQE